MKLAERRLDPAVFDLPVEKMRAGWYTDAYFNHARAALLEAGRHPRVLMQILQKNRKFVATQSSHCVARSDRVQQPLPNRYQEKIAHAVAQTIVDDFEII